MTADPETAYWAKHPTAPDALARCNPDAAVELSDRVKTGFVPTVGWWRRQWADGGA